MLFTSLSVAALEVPLAKARMLLEFEDASRMALEQDLND